MQISTRGAVDAFIVMAVMEAARAREAAGADIIHMEVGQPGTPAPRRAIEAARAAMDAGPLGYTVALGLPALRERIARRYAERHGLSIAPERIAITAGASGAFLLAFLALFDAGARVAVAAEVDGGSGRAAPAPARGAQAGDVGGDPGGGGGGRALSAACGGGRG